MNLLLAAFPPELGALLEDPPSGWTSACTGVGPIAAALATAHLVHEMLPDRVLFIGTCGAYDERLQVGDLISVSDVIDVTIPETGGDAYRPEIQASRWTADYTPGFMSHPVVATTAITRSLDAARSLSRYGAAENLELSGVFAACKARGIPVGAALAVANPVGPDGHAVWKINHAEVSLKLQQVLVDSGFLAAMTVSRN